MIHRETLQKQFNQYEAARITNSDKTTLGVQGGRSFYLLTEESSLISRVAFAIFSSTFYSWLSFCLFKIPDRWKISIEYKDVEKLKITAKIEVLQRQQITQAEIVMLQDDNFNTDKDNMTSTTATKDNQGEVVVIDLTPKNETSAIQTPTKQTVKTTETASLCTPTKKTSDKDEGEGEGLVVFSSPRKTVLLAGNKKATLKPNTQYGVSSTSLLAAALKDTQPTNLNVQKIRFKNIGSFGNTIFGKK